MFSLLHVHFESVLRTMAEARPDLLKKISSIFYSPHYLAASPPGRLQLLEGQIQQCARDNSDVFTRQVFERVVQTFLEELEENHVEHVDLRIGVNTRKWSWMNTIADGIQIFERERAKHPTITLSFLVALNFAKSFAEIDEIFDMLLGDQYVQRTFVGLDVNVLPEDFPGFVHSVPLILRLQQQGMKINLHLGELFENAFSKAVLSYVVPHRIGHGVKLLEDESLVAFLRRHAICLDMCPVSNTRLGVYDWNQPNNPAKKAMRLGIPVTINTDDPILFQTTLAQEMALARLSAEEITIIQTFSKKYRYRHG